MADTYEIPIQRRHYAGTAALEAGGLGIKQWAYDETNEYFGVKLADGTYRYHSRSKLFPSGAGTTPIISVAGSGNMVSIATPTRNLHINDAKVYADSSDGLDVNAHNYSDGYITIKYDTTDYVIPVWLASNLSGS